LINSTTLRAALKKIYGIEDKYLVPLDKGWYVPTFDKEDKIGTWIGYRVLMVKPNLRAGYTGTSYTKSVQCRFRLAFVGKQAEELALQTLLFDDRSDVVSAFEECQTQLNYTSRQLLTYPVREAGLNDSLCWFVDFDCQSFYAYDIKYKPWNENEVPPAQESWVPKSPSVDAVGEGNIKVKL
jgi:hypothetical protein